MNLFAFYAVRGYRLDYLASLTAAEKIFLHCARENYYEEESERMRAMLNERR